MSGIFKRSELTAADLKRWEQEADSAWVMEKASSRAEFIKSLQFFGNKIELRSDGFVYADGIQLEHWKQLPNGSYIHYKNGKNDKIVSLF